MQFTSDFVETMTKLANQSFFEDYDAEPVVYPQVFRVRNVSEVGDGKNWGQRTTIIGDDEPESIGFAEDHKFHDTGEGYSAKWATRLYQRGFEVTQEMLDNWAANEAAAKNFVSERSRQLGVRFAQRRDRFCANIFNKGVLTAGDTDHFDGSKANLQADAARGFIYDVLPFFDTAHPLFRAAGTTFSNHIVSAALTEPNLETALVRLEVTNARDELNREISLRANTMIANPTQEYTARKTLQSQSLPGSANNDINPVQGRLRFIPWHKITDTDAWFVGVAQQGLDFIQNGEPRVVIEMQKLRGKGVMQFSMIDEWTAFVWQWRYWLANNIAAS